MKLSKMKITTALIEKYDPCESRFNNWKLYHNKFKGDVLDFLTLTTITPQDKVWVCCRILPRDLVEVFAIDCAVQAQGYAATATAAAAYATTYAAAYATTYAADATDAANAYAYAAYAYAATTYAADATDAANAYAYAAYADAATTYAAAAAADERERQVDALIYLIMNYN